MAIENLIVCLSILCVLIPRTQGVEDVTPDYSPQQIHLSYTGNSNLILGRKNKQSDSPNLFHGKFFAVRIIKSLFGFWPGLNFPGRIWSKNLVRIAVNSGKK